MESGSDDEKSTCEPQPSQLYGNFYIESSFEVHPSDEIIICACLVDDMIVIMDCIEEESSGMDHEIESKARFRVISIETGQVYSQHVYHYKFSFHQFEQNAHHISVWKKTENAIYLLTNSADFLITFELKNKQLEPISFVYHNKIWSTCVWNEDQIVVMTKSKLEDSDCNNHIQLLQTAFREDGVLTMHPIASTPIARLQVATSIIKSKKNYLWVAANKLHVFSLAGAEWKILHKLGVRATSFLEYEDSMIIYGESYFRRSIRVVSTIDFTTLFSCGLHSSSSHYAKVSQIVSLWPNQIEVVLWDGYWYSFDLNDHEMTTQTTVWKPSTPVDPGYRTVNLFPFQDRMKVLTDGRLHSINFALPWKAERVLWIAWTKNSTRECQLPRLPKELLQVVISYTKGLPAKSEPIKLDRIHRG